MTRLVGLLLLICVLGCMDSKRAVKTIAEPKIDKPPSVNTE